MTQPRGPEEERREFPRLDVILQVTYRVLAHLDRETPEDQQAMVQESSKNLGMGGMCLRTKHLLEIGTVLGLDFPLPGREDVIRVLGRVAWAQEAPGVCEAGVEFVAVSEKDLNRLVWYVTDFYVDKSRDDRTQERAAFTHLMNSLLKLRRRQRGFPS